MTGSTAGACSRQITRPAAPRAHQRLVPPPGGAAALPPIPLHGLRHTYASLALAKGVNAAIVSRRLGHATVAFTLDIYSPVLPQVDVEAAAVIATFAGAKS